MLQKYFNTESLCSENYSRYFPYDNDCCNEYLTEKELLCNYHIVVRFYGFAHQELLPTESFSCRTIVFPVKSQGKAVVKGKNRSYA